MPRNEGMVSALAGLRHGELFGFLVWKEMFFFLVLPLFQK